MCGQRDTGGDKKAWRQRNQMGKDGHGGVDQLHQVWKYWSSGSRTEMGTTEPHPNPPSPQHPRVEVNISPLPSLMRHLSDTWHTPLSRLWAYLLHEAKGNGAFPTFPWCPKAEPSSSHPPQQLKTTSVPKVLKKQDRKQWVMWPRNETKARSNMHTHRCNAGLLLPGPSKVFRKNRRLGLSIIHSLSQK